MDKSKKKEKPLNEKRVSKLLTGTVNIDFINFQAFPIHSCTHPTVQVGDKYLLFGLLKVFMGISWVSRTLVQSSCFSMRIFPLCRSISRCMRSISFLWCSISSWWCSFSAASCSFSRRLSTPTWQEAPGTGRNQRFDGGGGREVYWF